VVLHSAGGTSTHKGAEIMQTISSILYEERDDMHTDDDTLSAVFMQIASIDNN
jgi:hypothetical protein